MPCRWLTSTILLTLRRFSFATSALIALTTSMANALRGLEMNGSSGVVAPTTPILMPRFSMMTLRASTALGSARPASRGSSAKTRFELTYGTATELLSMKSANTSGPKSNSWLPMPSAS